jgi:hypothetical protein
MRRRELFRMMAVAVLALAVVPALAACAEIDDDGNVQRETTTSRSIGGNTGQLQSTVEIRSSTVVPLATGAGESGAAGAVPLDWSFRYASLEMSLTGWESSSGPLSIDATCAVSAEGEFIALYLTAHNTGPAPYELWSSQMMLQDEFGGEASRYFFYPNSGVSADITVPAAQTLDLVVCAPLYADLNPARLVLVVGDPAVHQIRVPLAPDGDADLGSYVEEPLNHTLSYRGAEITLRSMALTTGVWSLYGGAGQAPAGTRYLLLVADVRNGERGYLSVAPTEIRLEFDGEIIGPSFTDHEQYRLIPGLDVGLATRSMAVFELPESITSVTLHLVADSSYTEADREASVALTLPTVP